MSVRLYHGSEHIIARPEYGKGARLSQRELAELSGVSVRQIQLFEQRRRDINHTKAIDVVRIGRVLGCKTEDLLQI